MTCSFYQSDIFHWIRSTLHSASQFNAKPLPNLATLEKVLALLEPALKNVGTAQILADKQCECDKYCYWDDFLGNGDHYKNETKKFYEDRVFSTSMALNYLIDTWTVRSSRSSSKRAQQIKLHWLPDTPAKVYSVILKAKHWLLRESWRFSKQNAFFSGSIKIGPVTPFSFPHNDFRWTNGTSLGPCSQYKSVGEIGGVKKIGLVVASVKGLIADEEYDEMRQSHECFGEKFPEWAATVDLNCKECVFPFWSSPALTNAMTLLAQSKLQSAGSIE